MASSARFKKTYFLAPNFDYPPGGSLALGSILTNPFDPSTCINAGGGLPFPSDMPLQTSLKLDWRDERSQRRGGAIGLWAQFLNLLGIEAEVGVKCAVDNSSVYQFDKLETQFIEPTKEYIEQSVLDVPSVVSHIIESGYRKPVYMITGIKTARGAAVATQMQVAMGGHLKLGADGLPSGIPVSAGPQASIWKDKASQVTFRGSSDFVFAYRLREIYYERKLRLRDRQFTKGALYELGDVVGEGDGEVEMEYALVVGQCASELETAASLYMAKTVDAVDEEDGSICACAMQID